MGIAHFKIHQQLGDDLGTHARSSIGVQGKRARCNALFGDSGGDQLLSQLRALVECDHPPDDIATEDVENHAQVKASQLDQPFEFRNIPAPDLIGLRGQ